MPVKTLIADNFHPDAIALLHNAGFQVEVKEKMSREEFLSVIPGYEVLLLRSRFKIDREVLDAAVKLRIIGRAGAGMENIDREYAQQKNILCINSPEGNRDSVGEHAIGGLLMLLHRLYKANTEMHNGHWDRRGNWGTELMGKTVGIIGYGNTGSRMARKLSGFDCRILAYDKYKSGFGNDSVTECTPEDIFREADILTLHVPLTSETHYLVNEAYINRFSKPFILLNTSRGPVVKTDDLVRCIENGKVTGAYIDVLEYEGLNFEQLAHEEMPAPLQYLVNSDKVILTPHIAGWTHESYRNISVILAEKVLQALL